MPWSVYRLLLPACLPVPTPPPPRSTAVPPSCDCGGGAVGRPCGSHLTCLAPNCPGMPACPPPPAAAVPAPCRRGGGGVWVGKWHTPLHGNITLLNECQLSLHVPACLPCCLPLPSLPAPSTAIPLSCSCGGGAARRPCGTNPFFHSHWTVLACACLLACSPPPTRSPLLAPTAAPALCGRCGGAAMRSCGTHMTTAMTKILYIYILLLWQLS